MKPRETMNRAREKSRNISIFAPSELAEKVLRRMLRPGITLNAVISAVDTYDSRTFKVFVMLYDDSLLIDSLNDFCTYISDLLTFVL